MTIKETKQLATKNRNKKTSSDSEFRFSPGESELALHIKNLQKDESNVAFAERCGISESGLRKLLNGNSPNLDTLSKIARANGVRISQLIGDAPLDVSFQHEEGVVSLIDNYVDVRGSAGPGKEVYEEAVVKVRMNARLLRERIGNNFSRIKIASVSGDSMEPTLSHGDQVLIDTSCDRFRDDAIYAIQQEGNLRFKRIRLKLDGSIEVRSDGSPAFDTYTAEVAAGFFIIGVVIPFKFGRFKV